MRDREAVVLLQGIVDAAARQQRHDERDRSITFGIPLRLAHRHDASVLELVQERRLVGRQRVLQAVHADGLLHALAVEDLVVREEHVVAAAVA